ncbi:MAG: hypothetical protein VW262_08175 [Flavobacteriaceae bacterium]
MRKLLAFLLFSSTIVAQITLTTIPLPKEIEETSGLERRGDLFITHNDSGDEPRIYFFTEDGKIVKSIEFFTMKNKDWEDIAADENHYYIADTGNNFATRENLRIYILDSDFNYEGVIKIKYAAQTTFSKESLNEYDAEALAVVGEELILFSKNRKTLQSALYRIPKTAGDYTLTPQTFLATNALVTAADYNQTLDLMVLTGYGFNGDQFFYTLKDFVKRGWENLELKRYLIPVKPAQIEAVKIDTTSRFWITSESEEKGTPRLFLLELKE